jgi:hypothetical protein
MSPILNSFGSLSARAFGFGSAPRKPVVTGGTLASDATYYYRTFTATANLVISNGPIAVEYLVIAGGGPGNFGGGGEAVVEYVQQQQR